MGPDGKRHELQLKGAGATPYSRTAGSKAMISSGPPTPRMLGAVVRFLIHPFEVCGARGR